MNEIIFTSGATATTLTLNDVLSDAYSIEANMKYEVSILEGVAYIKGVSMSETQDDDGGRITYKTGIYRVRGYGVY